ncbi:MAG: hypothetical protein JSS66_07340 [Armatimonadetes bacterium]|nr:hypothetical protein [Armatimonadota bacterium]
MKRPKTTSGMTKRARWRYYCSFMTPATTQELLREHLEKSGMWVRSVLVERTDGVEWGWAT